MFNIKYRQVKEMYSLYITKIWEESRTIIMEGVSSDIGNFPVSDIILVYDLSETLSIMTERLYRKEYSLFKWIYLKYKAKSLRNRIPDDTVLFSITKGEGFIDVVFYKKWWHEWAREII